MSDTVPSPAVPTMPATPIPQAMQPIVGLTSANDVFVALQEQAKDLELTLRTPPPKPTTCCGRGCNGCVWEGFYAAASCWQEDALAAIAMAKIG